MFVFVNNGQIMEKSISIQYKLNNLGSERNETEREREKIAISTGYLKIENILLLTVSVAPLLIFIFCSRLRFVLESFIDDLIYDDDDDCRDERPSD